MKQKLVNGSASHAPPPRQAFGSVDTTYGTAKRTFDQAPIPSSGSTNPIARKREFKPIMDYDTPPQVPAAEDSEKKMPSLIEASPREKVPEKLGDSNGLMKAQTAYPRERRIKVPPSPAVRPTPTTLPHVPMTQDDEVFVMELGTHNQKTEEESAPPTLEEHSMRQTLKASKLQAQQRFDAMDPTRVRRLVTRWVFIPRTLDDKSSQYWE